MSFLNPRSSEVKVYKSIDAGAPQLDKSPGCVATIIKACLATGYGDKDSAGWTMPYEDTAAKVKVFKPEVSVEQDYYLRLSQDTGKDIAAQVYLNMTDANTGDFKMQCATPFIYGAGATTGRWILIATGYGFWFFAESGNDNNIPTNVSGVYLYCGNVNGSDDSSQAIYIKHTGGTYGTHDDDRLSIITGEDPGASVVGKLYEIKSQVVVNAQPKCIFNGDKDVSKMIMASQIQMQALGETWFLPAFAPSRCELVNYDNNQASGRHFVNHSTGMWRSPNNIYVPTDYWEL